MILLVLTFSNNDAAATELQSGTRTISVTSMFRIFRGTFQDLLNFKWINAPCVLVPQTQQYFIVHGTKQYYIQLAILPFVTFNVASFLVHLVAFEIYI